MSKIRTLRTLLEQKFPQSVRNIEVSAITKHRSAVVAVLSAKSRFSAKTVSVKPSFWCTQFHGSSTLFPVVWSHGSSRKIPREHGDNGKLSPLNFWICSCTIYSLRVKFFCEPAKPPIQESLAHLAPGSHIVQGREKRTGARLYPGTRDSGSKRCKGRDRVNKGVFHPIPSGPKSWA